MIVSGRFFPQGRGSLPPPSACPPLRSGLRGVSNFRVTGLRKASACTQYVRGDIPPPRPQCPQAWLCANRDDPNLCRNQEWKKKSVYPVRLHTVAFFGSILYASVPLRSTAAHKIERFLIDLRNFLNGRVPVLLKIFIFA